MRDRVKITSLSDEAGDEAFLNQVGEIVSSEPYCGDTMFSVVLDDGRKDGFFAEELTKEVV